MTTHVHYDITSGFLHGHSKTTNTQKQLLSLKTVATLISCLMKVKTDVRVVMSFHCRPMVLVIALKVCVALQEGVLFDATLLMWVLKRTCPAVHKHLQHHGVEPLMFATDWLMCLFTRHLPFNMLLRVWDLFFCYGLYQAGDFQMFFCFLSLDIYFFMFMFYCRTFL